LVPVEVTGRRSRRVEEKPEPKVPEEGKDAQRIGHGGEEKRVVCCGKTGT
jgi:hypothetical protein